MKLLHEKITKNKFELFCIFIGLILLSISVYRAANTGITFDEGYTYVYYVRSNPFAVFQSMFDPEVLPNNHLLNTFFISVLNCLFDAKFSEFLIRIPNLFFYLVYFYFGYKICKKYKSKYAFFILLTFNYSTNEFFGLGRGYGISTALVLAGIYNFMNYLEEPTEFKPLVYSFIYFLVSCYANSGSLLIFATFLILAFVKLLKTKSLFKFIKKYYYIIIPMVFLTLLIIHYHFLICTDGKFVYGGNGTFYQEIIYCIFEYYGFNQYSLEYSIFFLVILSTVFLVNFKKNLHNYLILSPLIYFALLILFTKLTGALWMRGRNTIPCWPLIFIGIIELVNNLKLNFKENKYFSAILIPCCILLFSLNLNLVELREWPDDNRLRIKAYQAYYNKDNSYVLPYDFYGAIVFYREKILDEYNYDILYKIDNEE